MTPKSSQNRTDEDRSIFIIFLESPVELWQLISLSLTNVTQISEVPIPSNGNRERERTKTTKMRFRFKNSPKLTTFVSGVKNMYVDVLFPYTIPVLSVPINGFLHGDVEGRKLKIFAQRPQLLVWSSLLVLPVGFACVVNDFPLIPVSFLDRFRHCANCYFVLFVNWNRNLHIMSIENKFL